MDADSNSLVAGKICPACQTKYSPEMDRCPADNSFLAIIKRDPFIGRLIAEKYQIVEVLGQGGFSTVYKAEQEGLHRLVAIKILNPEFVDKPEKIRRFQQEAESISTLVHTNVAAVYDYGVMLEGQPYLVMEYAPGSTLAAVLVREGKLEPERAVEIFVQACDGIAAAHAAGLVHRDLKPSNIVLNMSEDGKDHVKILDFGLAKVISDEVGLRENLTLTGEIMGTPAYMAPEQCTGSTTDVRTDVYSFGCVMYETLSGRLAIDGDTSYEMMNKHINEAPLSLSKSGVPVPPKLVRIVSKALQKDPDDRYQDFVELKEALQGLEPAISKEFKRLIFSGGNTKLSKKKKTLKKRILLSTWSLALVAIAVAGLVICYNTSFMQEREIAKQYEGKTITYDTGMLILTCPAIFVPTDPNDAQISFRLINRVNKINYIDFKQLSGQQDAAASAASQRNIHQEYKHFVETIPIQKFDFGKEKKIHGYMTEFCADHAHGFSRERHVYFGEAGDVKKLKIAGEETKNSKFQDLCNTVLGTVEYFPDMKCTPPKVQ